MASLSEAQKVFVVQRLACYDTPQQVADAFKEQFGEEINRTKVFNYDPTRAGYRQAKKFRVIFEATRKAFLEDLTSIGIAQKSVRLRRLDALYDKAVSMKNLALAQQLMEQAAKEMGEAYTNKHRLEHTGRDGGPMKSDGVLRVEFVDPVPAGV